MIDYYFTIKASRKLYIEHRNKFLNHQASSLNLLLRGEAGGETLREDVRCVHTAGSATRPAGQGGREGGREEGLTVTWLAESRSQARTEKQSHSKNKLDLRSLPVAIISTILMFSSYCEFRQMLCCAVTCGRVAVWSPVVTLHQLVIVGLGDR